MQNVYFPEPLVALIMQEKGSFNLRHSYMTDIVSSHSYLYLKVVRQHNQMEPNCYYLNASS